MTRRMYLWLAPLLFYAVFTFWYTNTSGPLTDDEIGQFVMAMVQNGADPAVITRVRQFMETDTGRQFLMVNNIDMADDPGDVQGAEPGESADQIMNRYMEHMYPELFKRASHPVYVGEAVFDAMDIVGIEGAESWSRAALFRYRSRRDMMEITSNPAFRDKHHFKLAALDKTIAYPLENTLYLSDPRFLLALILLSAVALLDIALYGRNRS
ncbi:MAG: hypothetical protein QGD92_11505 [Gammaproteobacteria bacterium]|nr:hypothetical protein [Gammaproteobacteria bacterium]